MSDCLCDRCAGLCCRYFALPLDNPKTAKEYDNIRWYLMHQNVVVYIEKKQWYIGVLNPCKHLQPDNRCGVYETRPDICRKYSTDNCDYHGGEYDYEQLFTSAEQLRLYAIETLKKRGKWKPRRGSTLLMGPSPSNGGNGANGSGATTSSAANSDTIGPRVARQGSTRNGNGLVRLPVLR